MLQYKEHHFYLAAHTVRRWIPHVTSVSSHTEKMTCASLRGHPFCVAAHNIICLCIMYAVLDPRVTEVQ